MGGDSNRRGRGYTPYSCQKLLTEALPSGGQAQGCPYRTYSPDNLISLLQNVGVSDKELTKGVRELVGKQKYHVACNLVFEHAHKNELKKVRLFGAVSFSSANDFAGEGRITMACKRTGHHSTSQHLLQAQLSAQEPRQSAVWRHWCGWPFTIFGRVRRMFEHSLQHARNTTEDLILARRHGYGSEQKQHCVTSKRWGNRSLGFGLRKTGARSRVLVALTSPSG